MNIPKPKAILNQYVVKDDVTIDILSAIEFWLCNIDGSSYYLKWWGNGWVIYTGQSYFCKDRLFRHESEIPAFVHSHYGDSWQHVFSNKEDAVEHFRSKDFPKHDESEEFYSNVYDILHKLGDASADMKEAFVFNFSKDKFKDREWRFQGSLGFGGKYRDELNTVDCYSEDETPERLKIIKNVNTALKKLADEKNITKIIK